MQGHDLLTFAHHVPRFGVEGHPGCRLHDILFAGPTGAQTPRGHANREGIHVGDHSVGFGGEFLGLLGLGHRSVRVPTLRGDHRAPDVHRSAVLQRLAGVNVAILRARASQHLPGQGHRELNDVTGTASGQDFHTLGDLEPVARR